MSNDNMHDDAEFERFLAGEDDLSRQLSSLQHDEPSAELDAAVLAKIQGALAAEKSGPVETQPAANDPVGPAPASAPTIKPRRFAGFWYLPLGLAAGVLLTVGYRGYQHRQDDASVAAGSTKAVAQLERPPTAVAPAPPGDVAMVAQAKTSRKEQADLASPPSMKPPVAISAPSLAAAAPAEFAAPKPTVQAPVASPRRPASKAQEVTVTGSRIQRQDSETASPVQVIVAEQLKKSSYATVPDVLQNQSPPLESGTASAWGHDPQQDVLAGREAAKADRAKKAETQLAGAQPMPAPAPVASAPVPPPPPPVAARAVTSVPVAPQPATAAQAVVVAGSSPSNNNVQRIEITGSSVSGFYKETRGDPVKWLAWIERTIDDGYPDDALAEWDKFLEAHPAYPVKDELTAKIKALRAAKVEAAKADPAKAESTKVDPAKPPTPDK